MNDSPLIPTTRRDLTPEETERLTDDLAGGIHKPDTIAVRYGFDDTAHLKSYLLANPWIIETANRRKALLESDKGTGERVSLKAAIAIEETIPSIAGIIMNTDTAAKDRIDAFKELRQASSVGGAKEKQGVSGTSFSLTINMPDGRQEKIITTVAEQPALPDLPSEDDE